MASRKAIDSGMLNQLMEAVRALAPTMAETTPTADASSDEWFTVFETSVLDKRLLRAMKALGLPEPEVGKDIAAFDGEVVLGGEVVELSWPEVCVAITNGHAEASPDGWRLFPADDNTIDELAALKKQGVL